jgi:hypothetical protein
MLPGGGSGTGHLKPQQQKGELVLFAFSGCWEFECSSSTTVNKVVSQFQFCPVNDARHF